MRKPRHGLRMSRRVAAVTVAAIVVLAAGAGTVLADPGGLFGSNDNAWPYQRPRPRPDPRSGG
ncbi:MAG TPA: hypothetical protein VG186_01160 [Solirubrobacteraceae bacterium]|nr:hypothetical protein [Solirubrobacteraceae bacterium]